MLVPLELPNAHEIMQRAWNDLVLHVVTGQPGDLPKIACLECNPHYPFFEVPKLIAHRDYTITLRFQCGHMVGLSYGEKSGWVECYQGLQPQINGCPTSWNEMGRHAQASAPEWWQKHISYRWSRKPSGYLSYPKFLAMMFPALTVNLDQGFYVNLIFNRIFDDGPHPIWINKTLAIRTWSSPYPVTNPIASVEMPQSGLLFLPESTTVKMPKGDVCLFMGWRILEPGMYLWKDAPKMIAIRRLLLFVGSRSGIYTMGAPFDRPVRELIFKASSRSNSRFFKRVLGAFLSIHALKNLDVATEHNRRKGRATQWRLAERRTPCGHLRHAHWHTYLWGPQKLNRKTLWLEDIPVNGFEVNR